MGTILKLSVSKMESPPNQHMHSLNSMKEERMEQSWSNSAMKKCNIRHTYEASMNMRRAVRKVTECKTSAQVIGSLQINPISN